MNIECQKTENCFQNSQTYEYRLPCTASDFVKHLDDRWTIRRNDRLRRPVFHAEKDHLHVKGILSGFLIRVSFPDENCMETKEKFEDWLVHEFENL